MTIKIVYKINKNDINIEIKSTTFKFLNEAGNNKNTKKKIKNYSDICYKSNWKWINLLTIIPKTFIKFVFQFILLFLIFPG